MTYGHFTHTSTAVFQNDITILLIENPHIRPLDVFFVFCYPPLILQLVW